MRDVGDRIKKDGRQVKLQHVQIRGTMNVVSCVQVSSPLGHVSTVSHISEIPRYELFECVQSERYGT